MDYNPGYKLTPIMTKLILTFTIFFFTIMAFANIKVIDGAGHLVQLRKPATRIVSLAPNLTEILFKIGAGNKVVAVSSFSDYPRNAKLLPRIGDHQLINIEQILSLHANLVVAWASGTPISVIDKLRSLGIFVYVAKINKIEQIAKVMEDLGKLTGVTKSANLAAYNFMSQYRKLAHKYQKTGHKKSVFIEIASNPLYTVTNKSFVSQVIKLCGGYNVFGDLPNYAAMVSLEAVMVKKPQVIIALNPANVQMWYKSMQAVKHHKVFSINSDLLARPGPRILEGAKQVCERMACRDGKPGRL